MVEKHPSSANTEISCSGKSRKKVLHRLYLVPELGLVHVIVVFEIFVINLVPGIADISGYSLVRLLSSKTSLVV